MGAILEVLKGSAASLLPAVNAKMIALGVEDTENLCSVSGTFSTKRPWTPHLGCDGTVVFTP